MQYADKIKQHLTEYKKEYFPNLENGIWIKNKKSYPYILPIENKFKNILPEFRDDFKEYLKTQKIKLHIGFHHLNSSQAMCFNFFYPLIKEKELEIITEFLGFDNETINYQTVCFEKEGKEKDKDPTNFDFYFETHSNKKIFFEIKYSEYHFANAKNDTNHKEKYKNIYQKYLDPINNRFSSMSLFLENYQILRNLIHIEENTYVVFLYPKENKKIKAQSQQAKAEMLKKDFINHLFIVEWEEINNYILSFIKKTKLKKHFSEFKYKYSI